MLSNMKQSRELQACTLARPGKNGNVSRKKEYPVKSILVIAVACLFATIANATVKWDVDPPGEPPAYETGSSIADGNYIGKVVVISIGDDTYWIIESESDKNPEAVKGRLIISDNDLSSAEESTLNVAASQNDPDNYAHTQGDADISQVGTGGPYP